MTACGENRCKVSGTREDIRSCEGLRQLLLLRPELQSESETLGNKAAAGLATCAQVGPPTAPSLPSPPVLQTLAGMSVHSLH